MVVFDAHCDLLSRAQEQGVDLFWENAEGHWDLKRALRYRNWAQFFAIFADSQNEDPNSLQRRVQGQYDVFCQALKRYSTYLCQCHTVGEMESAFARGQIAAFLSVEGGELLDCSLARLEQAYAWGVRAVNLTWNRANALSGSAVEEQERGLSALGHAFVEKMQSLGMLVDVSHLSDAGFWDVIAQTRRPIIASHSNARALQAHPRNLSDAQFMALAKTGGIAGLNFYGHFLGKSANFETVHAHLEHFWALGGENHLALGGDWDGCDHLPQGMEDGLCALERLYEYLLQKNYGECLLNQLYHQNLTRVVKQICIM